MFYERALFTISLEGKVGRYANFTASEAGTWSTKSLAYVDQLRHDMRNNLIRGYFITELAVNIDSGEVTSTVTEYKCNPPPNIIELNVEAKPVPKEKKVKKVNVAFNSMTETLNHLAAAG